MQENPRKFNTEGNKSVLKAYLSGNKKNINRSLGPSVVALVHEKGTSPLQEGVKAKIINIQNLGNVLSGKIPSYET